MEQDGGIDGGELLRQRKKTKEEKEKEEREYAEWKKEKDKKVQPPEPVHVDMRIFRFLVSRLLSVFTGGRLGNRDCWIRITCSRAIGRIRTSTKTKSSYGSTSLFLFSPVAFTHRHTQIHTHALSRYVCLCCVNRLNGSGPPTSAATFWDANGSKRTMRSCPPTIRSSATMTGLIRRHRSHFLGLSQSRRLLFLTKSTFLTANMCWTKRHWRRTRRPWTPRMPSRPNTTSATRSRMHCCVQWHRQRQTQNHNHSLYHCCLYAKNTAEEAQSSRATHASSRTPFESALLVLALVAGSSSEWPYAGRRAHGSGSERRRSGARRRRS